MSRDIGVKPTVYIETSVISYLTAKPSRDLVVAAHQQITHNWWDLALPKLEGFISAIVLEEIARGADGGLKMHDHPLRELRHIRRTIEGECEDNPQKYYEYLSQAQKKYADRLVRRGPKPRLKVKERQS